MSARRLRNGVEAQIWGLRLNLLTAFLRAVSL
jgi:hypothetical protein